MPSTRIFVLQRNAAFHSLNRLLYPYLKLFRIAFYMHPLGCLDYVQHVHIYRILNRKLDTLSPHFQHRRTSVQLSVCDLKFLSLWRKRSANKSCQQWNFFAFSTSPRMKIISGRRRDFSHTSTHIYRWDFNKGKSF